VVRGLAAQHPQADSQRHRNIRCNAGAHFATTYRPIGHNPRDMNAATTIKTDEIRTALVSVAENFQPRRHQRFKLLIPLREEIRALRRRGASFEIIAELLRKHSVQTSHETVRRFCREVIEEQPGRRTRRRSTRSRSTHGATQSRPKAGATIPTDRKPKSPVTSSQPERGPRIARIEDL
jgi:IS30 family transposase